MLKEMKVAGITVDPFTNTPIVILKDLEEKDVLPIWIGLLRGLQHCYSAGKHSRHRGDDTRPPQERVGQPGGTCCEDRSERFRDNTYYALIHMDVSGKRLVIDSRPSDAIALALRVSAAIFVEESVIKKSAKIDLAKKEDKLWSYANEWEDVLETLSPDDFGKYKM